MEDSSSIYSFNFQLKSSTCCFWTTKLLSRLQRRSTSQKINKSTPIFHSKSKLPKQNIETKAAKKQNYRHHHCSHFTHLSRDQLSRDHSHRTMRDVTMGDKRTHFHADPSGPFEKGLKKGFFKGSKKQRENVILAYFLLGRRKNMKWLLGHC